MQKSLFEIYFETAGNCANNTAIIHKNKSIKYHELFSQVKKQANFLKKKGVKKGDRVLVFLPMSVDLYKAIFAINYIGAVAVVLDEWVSLKRLNICCKIAECHAMITLKKAKILSLFSKEIKNIPIKIYKYSHKNLVQLEEYKKAKNDDTALITFTTGSTGIPKAANRTYGFLNEQLQILNKEINPKKENVILLTLPIFAFLNLSVGSTTYIADFNQKKPEKLNAQYIYQQIVKYKITSIICSPNFILKIAQYCINNNLNLTKLKSIYTGGAPVFPQDAKLLEKAFPQTETTILYGSTEAEPISSIKAEKLSNIVIENEKGLSVGKIGDDIQVKIIELKNDIISLQNNQNISSIEQKTGDIGEIIVSGKHVLTNYFNKELLKRNKIIDGKTIWHRTGDAGFLDENRNLYLNGRANTMIKKDSMIISPFLAEAYFKSIKGVCLGTILHLNNNIIAILEIEKKSSKSEITAAVKNYNLKFDEILFLKKIPRDPRHFSKIDYDLLRELITRK